MNLWKNVISAYFVYIFHLHFVGCHESSTNFTIFWTIPTSYCKAFGVDFDDFLKSIPVIKNPDHLRKSNRIVLLNNPELLGNLPPEKFSEKPYVSLQKTDMHDKIYSTFAGLGILNYTRWQPIFRQNRGPLEYFYNSSIELEKKIYPFLNEDQTLQLAEMRFEFAASFILENLIINIKNAWPEATWGFFDYPKCANQHKYKLSPQCDEKTMEDNDKLSWLWELDIALFPSLLISVQTNLTAKKNFVEARLREAERISQKYDPRLKIYPYLALSYDDYRLFMSREELIVMLRVFFTIKTDGLIIGGNENDVNSSLKCHELYNYSTRYLQGVLTEFWELIQHERN